MDLLVSETLRDLRGEEGELPTTLFSPLPLDTLSEGNGKEGDGDKDEVVGDGNGIEEDRDGGGQWRSLGWASASIVGINKSKSKR